MCNHCSSHHQEHRHHNHDSDGVTLFRVFVAIIILLVGICIHFSGWVKFVVYLTAYLIAGGDVLFKALRNILKGEVFDENFLMGLASAGAFAIGEYPEAVMVMVLYQIGEYFQDKAVEKSRNSISELMNIRPDYANIESDGNIIKVSPEK